MDFLGFLKKGSFRLKTKNNFRNATSTTRRARLRKIKKWANLERSLVLTIAITKGTCTDWKTETINWNEERGWIKVL